MKGKSIHQGGDASRIAPTSANTAFGAEPVFLRRRATKTSESTCSHMAPVNRKRPAIATWKGMPRSVFVTGQRIAILVALLKRDLPTTSAGRRPS